MSQQSVSWNPSTWQWRPMSMRYGNNCMDCHLRLQPGTDCFYAKPQEKWYFRCPRCHLMKLSGVQSPSLINSVDVSHISSSQSPHKERQLPSTVAPTTQLYHPTYLSVTSSPAKATSKSTGGAEVSPTRPKGYEQVPSSRSPMKLNVPIRQFTAKMPSLCASCNRLIGPGEEVYGQKPDNEPWIITCHPSCNAAAYRDMLEDEYNERIAELLEDEKLADKYTNSDLSETGSEEEHESGDENATVYSEEDDEDGDESEDGSAEEENRDHPASQETVDLDHRNKPSTIQATKYTVKEQVNEEEKRVRPGKRKRSSSSPPQCADDIKIVSADAIECCV